MRARPAGGARALLPLARGGLAAVGLLSTLSCAASPQWTPASLSPGSGRDFSLRWDAVDRNGLPLNPGWAGAPATADQLPPRHPDCIDAPPDSPACTDQRTSRDAADGPHADACAVTGETFSGHVNWTAATYSGRLWWGHLADDGDINLHFEADDPLRGLTTGNDIAPLTGRPFLQLEFMASEVLPRAATDFWRAWWRRIEQWAAGAIETEDVERLLSLRAPGQPSRAVIIGLFNLDCGHACKTELHPVYALAVEINTDRHDNTWAIFARNWGTEGACSRQNHLLVTPNHQLTIDIPAPRSFEAADVHVDVARSQAAVSYAGTPPPHLQRSSSGGVRVTFALPPPDASAVSELVLHLDWTGAAATTRAPRPFAGDAAAGAAVDANAHVGLAAIAAGSLNHTNSLVPLDPRDRVLRAGATSTPSLTPPAPPATRLASADVIAAKRRADDTRLRLLCQASRTLLDDLGPRWRRACAAMGIR